MKLSLLAIFVCFIAFVCTVHKWNQHFLLPSFPRHCSKVFQRSFLLKLTPLTDNQFFHERCLSSTREFVITYHWLKKAALASVWGLHYHYHLLLLLLLLLMLNTFGYLTSCVCGRKNYGRGRGIIFTTFAFLKREFIEILLGFIII